MRLSSYLIAGIVTLSALGCSSGTEPGVPFTPTLRYALDGAPGAPEGGSNPPTVTIANGKVTVLGLITAGTPCHELSSKAVSQDSVLEIAIVATEQQGVCIQVIANLAYEAVAELPAGTQRIRVVHVSRADERSVVYDEPVP